MVLFTMTFASSYGTTYAMAIQSMCQEEGMYGYNVNASGRRCASTVFIMVVSGIILYLVYGVGSRDLGERLEAKDRRRKRREHLLTRFSRKKGACRMIRNIIFDMGQVLIRWEPEALLQPFALTPRETEQVLTELFRDVEWVQLDHGTISLEQAVKQVCERLPEKLHPVVQKLVFGWWERPLTPIPGMGELVRELKAKGYGIYLLSNASIDLRRYFHRIPGSECFDGLVVSAEERCMKPQREVYTTLLNRYGLKGEECFFIDDAPANVEGALCVGISGTVFRQDVQRLRETLHKNRIL